MNYVSPCLLLDLQRNIYLSMTRLERAQKLEHPHEVLSTTMSSLKKWAFVSVASLSPHLGRTNAAWNDGAVLRNGQRRPKDKDRSGHPPRHMRRRLNQIHHLIINAATPLYTLRSHSTKCHMYNNSFSRVKGNRFTHRFDLYSQLLATGEQRASTTPHCSASYEIERDHELHQHSETS